VTYQIVVANYCLCFVIDKRSGKSGPRTTKPKFCIPVASPGLIKVAFPPRAHLIE